MNGFGVLGLELGSWCGVDLNLIFILVPKFRPTPCFVKQEFAPHHVNNARI